MTDAPPPPPGSTRASRLAGYVQRMFPPLVLVPSGLSNVLSIHWALDALAGTRPVVVTWRTLLCAVAVVLFMLLLRVYDELKDVETDLRLGRAGDPRFKDRPIATGAVQPADLVALRWWVTGALVLVAAPLCWPAPALPLAGFALAFGVTWASLHYFFWPRVATSLLLQFVTHNPMSLVVSAFVVLVWAGARGLDALGPWTVPLVVSQWLPVAAWETSRKVRVPADETDYTTYSKLLGLRAAALVPGLFAVAGAAAAAAVARAAGLGWAYPALAGLGAAALLARGLLLAAAPTPARAHLRPWAEAFAVIVGVGLCVALGATHGVR